MPTVAVGIVCELMPDLFDVAHGGLECRTNIDVKIAVTSWMVAMASVFGVSAGIVRRFMARSEFHLMQLESVTNLVDAEIGIAKYAFPILLCCIFLNFTHLVNYSAGRSVFLALIMVMHTKSSWVLFAAYVFGNGCARRNAEYHIREDDEDHVMSIEMQVINEEVGFDTRTARSLMDRNAVVERMQNGGAEFDDFLDYLTRMCMDGEAHTIEASFESDEQDDGVRFVDTVNFTLSEWCSMYRDFVDTQKRCSDDGAEEEYGVLQADTAGRVLNISERFIDGPQAELSAAMRIRCIEKLVRSARNDGAESDLRAMIESVVSFMRALMLDNFFEHWEERAEGEDESERDADEQEEISALLEDGFIMRSDHSIDE
jgi:hypothetical protein